MNLRSAQEDRSLEDFPKRGTQDHDPDGGRGESCDQHGPCGRILGAPNQRIWLGVDGISEFFQCRIEGFGTPHRTDGENQPAPVHPRDVEYDADHYDRESGRHVNPGVVLRTKDKTKPAKCMAKTAQAVARRKAAHTVPRLTGVLFFMARRVPRSR